MIATDDETGAALLRAIIQEPDEDTHRLVYADWLDENGQAVYANFIREQIARAKQLLPPIFIPLRNRLCSIGDGTTITDRYAAKWLMGPHSMGKGAANLWREILPPPDEYQRCWAYIRRGFLHSLDVSTRWWEWHGTAICQKQPIQVVRISNLQRLIDTEPITDRSDDDHIIFRRWPSIQIGEYVSGCDV